MEIDDNELSFYDDKHVGLDDRIFIAQERSVNLQIEDVIEYEHVQGLLFELEPADFLPDGENPPHDLNDVVPVIHGNFLQAEPMGQLVPAVDWIAFMRRSNFDQSETVVDIVTMEELIAEYNNIPADDGFDGIPDQYEYAHQWLNDFVLAP